MLTYLHDIRNKLTLISVHTALLSKKYGEEEFFPIRTNLVRISELINDAYRELQRTNEYPPIMYTPQELVRQMDLLTETAQLLFPVQIKNETRDYKPQDFFHIELNIQQVFQVIENALDNSVKAQSTKIIIRLLDNGTHCIYEIVDNGTGKQQQDEYTTVNDVSIIPHGIGKEIMIRNMKNLHGKVEWARRMDQTGMIVRLYFPKKV